MSTLLQHWYESNRLAENKSFHNSFDRCNRPTVGSHSLNRSWASACLESNSTTQRKNIHPTNRYALWMFKMNKWSAWNNKSSHWWCLVRSYRGIRINLTVSLTIKTLCRMIQVRFCPHQPHDDNHATESSPFSDKHTLFNSRHSIWVCYFYSFKLRYNLLLPFKTITCFTHSGHKTTFTMLPVSWG